MWNITPEDAERVKEELKGRRAAIQARYDDEIQKLTVELDDIVTFERVAAAFAQRHKQEEASSAVEPNPIAPLEALPIAANVAAKAREAEDSDDPWSGDHSEIEILPEAEALPTALDAGVMQKASRWRMRG